MSPERKSALKSKRRKDQREPTPAASGHAVRQLDSIQFLAAGLSHDFNNILTGILGNLSLARAQLKSPGKLDTILESTQKATLRARDLSLQLQTLAKGGTPERERVSIASLLRETSAFIMRGTNCECRLDLAEDLWQAEAQPAQVSQVFDNLLINAIHAMPDGGVITITAKNKTLPDREVDNLPGGNYICIRVEDTGTGIPAENLSEIFSPYFSTKPRGSGLGLATAFSIISSHGGHICAESEAGKGTAFTIYLPGVKTAAAPPPAAPAAPRRGAGKILLLDDDEMIRQITGDMLKTLGYKVDFASTGEDLLKKHAKYLENNRSCTAIIMDLTLEQGISAKETIKRLREMDPKVCVIVSSGFSNDPVMNRYHQYGFNGCIIKPYDMHQLGAVIEAVLKENGG